MKNEAYNDLFNNGSKPVDYKTLFFEYLLHWRFIAICLVLALVGTYIYLRYQTPVYKIASTVLIKQGEKNKANSVAQMAVMQELQEIDVNRLTPLEAMQLIYDWQEKVRNL